jgi:hypothetical protein
VAKVLARRLAKVMDGLVDSTQSAFLKGRYLVDREIDEGGGRSSFSSSL